MNIDKAKMVLEIVGALCLGLPAFFHALRLFLVSVLQLLKLIPGPFGEAAVEKAIAVIGGVEETSKKMGDVAGKFFPQPKA